MMSTEKNTVNRRHHITEIDMERLKKKIESVLHIGKNTDKSIRS